MASQKTSAQRKAQGLKTRVLPMKKKAPKVGPAMQKKTKPVAAKNRAAYKATKGTSSKKAVRRTALRVQSRGKSTGAAAIKKARQIVRKRKMRANK